MSTSRISYARNAIAYATVAWLFMFVCNRTRADDVGYVLDKQNGKLLQKLFKERVENLKDAPVAELRKALQERYAEDIPISNFMQNIIYELKGATLYDLYEGGVIVVVFNGVQEESFKTIPGKLQRQAAGRMPQPTLVRRFGRSAGDRGSVALRLQPAATAQRVGQPHAAGVRGAAP